MLWVFLYCVGVGVDQLWPSALAGGYGGFAPQLIGKYDQKDYLYSQIHWLARVDQLTAVMPKKLQEAVDNATQQGVTFDYFLMVTGVPARGTFPDNTRNIILHPQVRAWVQEHKADVRDNFAVNVQAGLFRDHDDWPRAAPSNAVAIDAIAPLNVHLHDGRFSPDNGRFLVPKERELLVFWTVAYVLPGTRTNTSIVLPGRGVVVYTMYALSDQVSQALDMLQNTNATVEGTLSLLSSLLLNVHDEQERLRALNIINTLEIALMQKRGAHEYASEQLRNLYRQLQALV